MESSDLKKNPAIEKHSLQLKILGILHYIVGVIGCLAFLVPLWWLILIIWVAVFADFTGSGPKPIYFEEWLFICLVLFAGFGLFIVGEIISIRTIISGRFMRQAKKYSFSKSTAYAMFLFFPLGTLLSVFTIKALSKNSVKNFYESQG